MMTVGGVTVWRQADAARYLGVDRQRIRVLIVRGDLATVDHNGIRCIEHGSLMKYASRLKELGLDAELLSVGRRVR